VLARTLRFKLPGCAQPFQINFHRGAYETLSRSGYIFYRVNRRYLGRRSAELELLGRQEVDFRHDRDRIEVGRQEGRFKQLQARVEGALVEMRRMTVTFANNETFSPNLRHRFEKNSKTRNIDLPGDRRTIKSIDFDYASLDRRQDRATVAVYGR
jgi:hypothetical protein